MRILAVDDEKISLEALVDAINEALPNEEVVSFRDAKEALEYVKNNKCDVAFLDMEMPCINGIELARRLKEANENISIFFVYIRIFGILEVCAIIIV